MVTFKGFTLIPLFWSHTHYSMNAHLTSWHAGNFRIIEAWSEIFRFSGLSNSIDRTFLSMIISMVMNVNFKVPYLVLDSEKGEYVK